MSNEDGLRVFQLLIESAGIARHSCEGAEQFITFLERNGHCMHDAAREAFHRYFGMRLSRDRGHPPVSFNVRVTCGVDVDGIRLLELPVPLSTPPKPAALYTHHNTGAQERFDVAFLRELFDKPVCLIGAVFISASASNWGNDGWVYLADDGLAIRCNLGWNYLYTADSLEELWYGELFAETDRDRYLVLDVPEIIERQQHYGFF